MNPLIAQIAAAAICSSAVWMRSSIDFIGWSVFECLAAVLAIVQFARKDSWRVPHAALVIAGGMLLAHGAASLLWTSHLHSTLTGVYKIIACVFYFAMFVDEPEVWQQAFKKAAAAVGGLTSAFLIARWPAALQDPPHGNLLAGFLAIAALCALRETLDSAGARRILYLIVTLVIAQAQMSLLSLGASLGLSAGVLVQIALWSRRRFALLLPALALPVLVFLSMKDPQLMLRRKLMDPYAGERLQIWADSLRYWWQHPVLGTGMGTFRDHYPQYKTLAGLRLAPYAHSEWINVACEMGLAGLLLVAGALWLWARGFGDRERVREWLGLWGAIFLACMIQAFVDFQLRYPPVAAPFLVSLSAAVPARVFIPRPAARTAGVVLSAVLALIFVLPGAAQSVYLRSREAGEAARREAAIQARRLDPLNAFYSYEERTAEGVERAVRLNPRNVWYRRSLAQWHWSRWKELGSEPDREAARRLYADIMSLAPGVPQLRKEAENLN